MRRYFSKFKDAKTGETIYLEKRSLNIFDSRNSFRQLCVYIQTHKLFEVVVMMAIMANSITLALVDYKDPVNFTTHNKRLDYCGDIFTWLFLLEAIINIVTLGLIGGDKDQVYIKDDKVVSRRAYLRDPWNQLDFVIVVAGVLGFVLQSDSKEADASSDDTVSGLIQILRLLRVLRPLKSIKTLPGMQALVGALIKAIPELVHVAIFFLFIFMLFGIMGLQEFSGILYNRCRIEPEPKELPNGKLFWEISDEYSAVCSMPDVSGLY